MLIDIIMQSYNFIQNNVFLIIYIGCQVILAYAIGRRIFSNKARYIRQRFFVYGIAPVFIVMNASCLANKIGNYISFKTAGLVLFKIWLLLSIAICIIFFLTKIWRIIVRIIAKINFIKSERNVTIETPKFLNESRKHGRIVRHMNNFEHFKNALRIEEVNLEIGNYSPESRALRILQLTDLHIGAYFHPDMAQEVVTLSNEQHCDLVLLTGDFINLDRRMAGPCIDILSQLKAPLGVYGCLGNHEIITETEDYFTRELAARSITILRNEYQRIAYEQGDFYLLGVDYFTAAMKYKEACKLFKYIPSNKTLVLCHNPNYFPIFAHYNAAVTFSGHTHGGQIKFEVGPAVIAPSLFLSPYLHGHYCLNKSHLYVSRGLGTSGAPIRLFCPPEITVFNLTMGTMDNQ
ncbi:MAG: hypothetical protein A2Y62_12195 [Candidatus Fischerbacteria bacterium RBG_13_37_8]|uniref:Calcineurin-like phosphoesterase domain-containing protein n=1 Tax=Candidatus Fischerbacteria bacterium RBG_13_37_8 TaxID=1817863 RepID=A0A1F5VDD4_9BACT|nr:MAG: hypothetical protein A2Y62_12195 [Candidatus Fischerbacteria bacterium RBG_13_37_8]